MKNTIYTIPNFLSIIRLVLVPFITVAYVKEWYVMSTTLLAFSGLTDLLDGVIARKFNQITDLGKILDPLADKLTMGAIVFALMLNHTQIRLLFIVVLIKESLTLTGAYVLLRQGKRPSESKLWGKLSTAMLYIVLTIVLLSDVAAAFNADFTVSSNVMWIMSVVCSLLMIMALVQYYPIFMGIRTGKYSIEAEKFVDGNTNEKNK